MVRAQAKVNTVSFVCLGFCPGGDWTCHKVRTSNILTLTGDHKNRDNLEIISPRPDKLGMIRIGFLVCKFSKDLRGEGALQYFVEINQNIDNIEIILRREGLNS